VRFISTSSPLAASSVPPFAQRSGLIWIGSAHYDNQRSLEFVAQQVLPLVRARVGAEDAMLVVVGGGTADIVSLRGLEGVRVMGHVRDVDPLLAAAKLCVSPTLYGRPRFQTKHLQALARGVPVVTTERGSFGYRLVAKDRNASGHTSTCESLAPWQASEAVGSESLEGARGLEEACGWVGVTERDCEGWLSCCWVPGSGGGGRCVRGFREYHRGHGVVVAAPGLTRPGGEEEGARARERQVDAWEARLLAEVVAELLSRADIWELESTAARRLVEDEFREANLVGDLRDLLAAVGVAAEGEAEGG